MLQENAILLVVAVVAAMAMAALFIYFTPGKN